MAQESHRDEEAIQNSREYGGKSMCHHQAAKEAKSFIFNQGFILVKTSVLLFPLLVANQWKPKNVSNFFIPLSIELRTLGIICNL